MKSKEIVLFVLPDDINSEKAEQQLREKLDRHYRVQTCPDGMRRLYPIPFVTLEDQSPIYGLENIEYFLEHQSEFEPAV